MKVDGSVSGVGRRVNSTGAEAAIGVATDIGFVQSSRVLALESSGGVRFDVIFGLLPFEAEAIARRRWTQLDRGYLEPRIRALAELLERPDILGRWKRWLASY